MSNTDYTYEQAFARDHEIPKELTALDRSYRDEVTSLALHKRRVSQCETAIEAIMVKSVELLDEMKLVQSKLPALTAKSVKDEADAKKRAKIERLRKELAEMEAEL